MRIIKSIYLKLYHLADRGHAYYLAFGMRGAYLFMCEFMGSQKIETAMLKNNRIKTPISLIQGMCMAITCIYK